MGVLAKIAEKTIKYPYKEKSPIVGLLFTPFILLAFFIIHKQSDKGEQEKENCGQITQSFQDRLRHSRTSKREQPAEKQKEAKGNISITFFH
jgi:hypothetical protein|nr:MAG TPA: Lhca1, Type II chlorophyll a/b, membrane complex, chlorophyll, light [Caudoviricetes sp.]